jgi:hypothetical protein
MYKKLLLLIFTLFIGSYAHAQIAYNLKLVPTLSPSEDSLYIDFMIRRTSSQTFTLGNSNFVVDLNTAALDTSKMEIAQEGIWSPSANPERYSEVSLGRGATGSFISLNISIVTNSGLQGIDVPDTDALLARIRIKIKDCNLLPDLQWRSSGASSGVINDFNGNDIKPYATFTNPVNSPLKVKIGSASVSSSSGSSNIFFQWNQVLDASRYEITFDSGATWKNIYTETSYDSTGLSYGDSLIAKVRSIRFGPVCNDTSYSSYVKEKITTCPVMDYEKSADTSFCQLGTTHQVWVNNFSPSGFYEVSWNGGPFQDSTVADYNRYTVDISKAGMQVIKFALRKVNVTACVIEDSIKVDVSPVDPAWSVAGGKDTLCIGDPSKRLIPESGGGVFSGPGVYLDPVTSRYYFKPQDAGTGAHNVAYTVCGITQTKTIYVSNAPCVSTIISPGSGPYGSDYVRQPQGIFTDCDGNIYVSDSRNHVIRKIDTLGVAVTIAGKEPFYDPDKKEHIVYSGDNVGSVSASNSLLNNPMGIVVLKNGDVYFNDSFNHKLKKISAGTVATVAGDPSLAPARGNVPLPGEGAVSGLSARFSEPTGLAVDPSETYLYIADKENYQIKRYTIATGEVISFAGSGMSGFANGNANQAKFGMLASLTADVNRVYVADRGNNTIRVIKITSNADLAQNQVSNLTNGDGSLGNRYRDGDFTTHRTNNPYGVSVDGSGHVFFADTDNHSIRKIDSTSNVLTIAGSMPPDAINGFVSGTAAEARFDQPTALSIYIKGFLDVADTRNNAIRRIAIDNYREGMWNGLNTDFNYCLGEAPDTLDPLYGGGTYSGPSRLLKQVNGKYVFMPDSIGTFTLEYIYAVGGCMDVFSQQVTVTPVPESALKDTTILCAGTDSVTLTAGDASNTYKWNGPNGFTSTEPSVTVSEAGTYSVDITNSFGCTETFTSVVKQSPRPTGTASANPAQVCIGSGTMVSASFDTGFVPDSTAAYSFDGGANFQAAASFTIPVINSDTAVAVVLKDINGCTSAPIIVDIKVMQLPQPVVSANPNPVCYGGSTIVSAGVTSGSVAAQNGYSFDGGKTFQTSNAISLTNLVKDTTISVIVVGENGCRSAVASYTVDVVPLPTGTVSLDKDTICFNTTATITATFDEGFLPHADGAYSFDGGTSFQVANKFTTTNLNATTTVNVVFRDVNGCLSQVYPATITVQQDLALNLSVTTSADSVCKGATVTITAVYDGAAEGIEYSFDNGQTYGAENSIVIPAINSDTAVNILVKDGTGCVSSLVNVPVKLYKPKGTVETEALICENTATTLTVNLLPGYTPAQEAYSFDGGLSYQESNLYNIGNVISDTTVWVRMKDVNGCLTDSIQVNIQTKPRPEGTAVAIVNPVCYGSDARIEAGFIKGTPHPDGGYSLQGGQFQKDNILTVRNLVKDTTVYVVLRNSVNCLSQPIPVHIKVNPKPEGTAVASPSNVCSGSTTLVKASLKAGFMPHPDGSFSFNNGPFTHIDSLRLTNVKDATTVIVKFRDVNGCISDFYTVNINVSPAVNAKATASPDSVCKGSGTVISASFVGAAILHAEGSYSFDGGKTYSSINTFATGPINSDTTFKVLIRNDFGCISDTALVPVRLYKPQGYIDAPSVVCSGSDVSVTASFSAGYTPASSNAYSLDGGLNFGDVNLINLSNLQKDTTFYVVLKDVNGCLSDIITKAIKVVPKPAGLASASPVCFGSTAQISVDFTSGTPHPVGGYSLDGQNFTSSSILTIPDLQQDTTVYVWLRDANGCISDSIKIDVDVLPLPTGKAMAQADSVCLGSVATVTASFDAGFSAAASGGYSFDGGVNFQESPVYTTTPVMQDTVVTVVLKDVNDCLSEPITVNIRTLALPVAEATVTPEEICGNGPVTVAALKSDGYTYSFDGGLTFQQDNIFDIANVSADTTIRVVVKNQDGCNSAALNLPVKVNSLPTGTLNPDATAICINSGTTVTALGSAGFVPNSAGAYSFDGGKTFQTINKLAVGSLLQDTTITVVLRDEKGCTSLPIITNLKVVYPPVAALEESGTVSICAGESKKLTAKGGASYQWMLNGQPLQGQTGENLMVSAAGLYSVVAFNEYGCSDTSSVTADVVVQPLPVVSLGNDIVACVGEEVVLDAGISGVTYKWNSNAAQSDKQLVVREPGAYYVEVTTPLGCSSVDTINVRFLQKPAVGLEKPGTFCSNEIFTVTAAVSGDALTLEWSTNGAGTLMENNNGLSVTYTPSPYESGEVTFSLKAMNACDTAEAITTATILYTSSAAFTPSKREIFLNEEVRFTINQIDAETKYFWSFGDGETSTETDPVHVFKEGFDHKVRLIAESKTGCLDTSEVVISVIKNQQVFVPNIFSPRSSHADNRTLKVFGTNIQAGDFMFRVFNRWGQVVYETNSLTQARQEGWNGGMLNSTDELPVGVYTFTVKGKYLDGTSFEKVGTATLMK